ncbi:hypothetical protein PVAND_005224 [Polypedilum vanderplanki]|uniref:Dynein heavy chain linker domain-containing protein n=1 Tax=Polypedilum vanderplanki TaxID=319348 RepID=A0A9J6BZA7_POLVA|nr:hypothetical protein PVAND_005224 [Polypedilum vanderplanki]
MLSDDVENILTSLGIERHQIVPTNVSQKILRQKSKFSQFDSDISYFPLEWFDSEIDRSNSLSLCNEGIAFLPSSSSLSDYEWRKVSIKQYINKSNKWHIVDDSGSHYEVPRIYLMFITEDLLKFCNRIQHAVQQRNDCERYLRFEAVLNAYPMHNIPQSFAYHRDRIIKLLLPCQTKKEENASAAIDLIEFYQREYTFVFQKILAAQQLIKFSPSKNVMNWIELLGNGGLRNLEVKKKKKEKLKNLTMECLHASSIRCKKSQRHIQQLWLYCCPQSIKIMEFIVDECEHVSRMSLFHLQTSSECCCSWEMFRNENLLKLQSMSELLQAQWIDKIVEGIQIELKGIGKGWFELEMSDWSLYKISKIRRLIELVKQRMQVSITILLRSSLRDFVNHLCGPCKCLLDISDDFEWNSDNLLNSPFCEKLPIFHVYLNFNETETEPKYSILDLEQGRIETEIIEIFEQAVLITHEIPQIDPFLMENLKFDKSNLKLSSIGLLDYEIQSQILYLRQCYKKCFIPLFAYARQYKKFTELKLLNVFEYIENKKKLSAKDIQTEIKNQMKFYDDIKISVPERIIIGPFLIDLKSLKDSLVNKRLELVKSLKQLLLSMANEKIDIIQQRYDAIIERLKEKPLSIEQLNDIAKWIPSVTQNIDQVSSEMQEILAVDFKCIESFLMALPDEMFVKKWKALQMPQIVNRQINETRKQHEFDIERFRKMHESDTTVFGEKIDEIARDIDARIRECSLEDYQNASDKIDSVWNNLQSLIERGRLLNKRCEIFNQPEINIERLNVLERCLLPHHKLWTMTSYFLTSKEMWTEQMPLSMLDVQSIEAEMKRYGEMVEEAPWDDVDSGLMSVVKQISDEMKEMMEFVDIIKDMLNPNIHDKHWKQMLGFELNKITLNELLKNRNVSRIKELIKEANDEATREREEQFALEMKEKEKQRIIEEERLRKIQRRLARTDIFN